MATRASIKSSAFNDPVEFEPLLTPGEVMEAFRVSYQTVARWAGQGLLSAIRTPGGQRRFALAEVRAALAAGLPPAGAR